MSSTTLMARCWRFWSSKRIQTTRVGEWEMIVRIAETNWFWCLMIKAHTKHQQAATCKQLGPYHLANDLLPQVPGYKKLNDRRVWLVWRTAGWMNDWLYRYNEYKVLVGGGTTHGGASSNSQHVFTLEKVEWLNLTAIDVNAADPCTSF